MTEEDVMRWIGVVVAGVMTLGIASGIAVVFFKMFAGGDERKD